MIASEAEAQAAHADGTALKRKLGLATVGVITIAAAPFLVLAAAPAGLAGGAAFVAGLAALGPSGIAGGLMVVGAMGGVGGVAVTAGLVAGSPAAVEDNVVFLQTLALSSKHLHCSVTHHREWTTLQQMKTAVTDELAMLGEVCDPAAVPLKASAAKLATIERALLWFGERGLSPAALPPASEDA